MIKIINGDITKLNEDIDVIVNAANKKLIRGMGVDGAIHQVAGPMLQIECLKLKGCETGEAKLTKAYNLPYKGIIHTVAPIHYQEDWAKSHNYNQNEMLSNCYKNSLQLALDNGWRKIAFPALGCGVYDWKYEDATKIAIDTIQEFINEKQMEVYLVFYEDEGYEIANKLLNNKSNNTLSLDTFIVNCCENIECNDCPVIINNYEKRTEKEKKLLHIPCVENLKKWIINESLKESGLEELLKNIVITNEGCSTFCKNTCSLKGYGNICNDDSICKNYDKLELDYEKLKKEYKI